MVGYFKKGISCFKQKELLLGNAAICGQYEVSVGIFAKQAAVLMSAYCDEVCAGCAVIVFLETGMFSLREVWHKTILFFGGSKPPPYVVKVCLCLTIAHFSAGVSPCLTW